MAKLTKKQREALKTVMAIPQESLFEASDFVTMMGLKERDWMLADALVSIKKVSDEPKTGLLDRRRGDRYIMLPVVKDEMVIEEAQ